MERYWIIDSVLHFEELNDQKTVNKLTKEKKKKKKKHYPEPGSVFATDVAHRHYRHSRVAHEYDIGSRRLSDDLRLCESTLNFYCTFRKK